MSDYASPALALILGFALMMMLGPLLARGEEEHSHPPQDAQIHEQFYATWNMPNGGRPRVQSCCNKHDCYPTTVEHRFGLWFAKRREDGKMMVVPPSKVEHDQPDPRESPDGRAHVCAGPPTPGYPDYYSVYCFVLGIQS